MNIKVIGWVKKTIEYCLGFLEKPSKSFLTYHARPKRSDDTLINLSYCKGLDLHKIAIVVQGPLVLDDDLTFETIKLYKKNFPSSRIVLSTWEGEDDETIGAIERLNVDVIKSKKPLMAGVANVNFQIASTSAGIKHATSLACEYVLKTRTDQRIYSSQALHFCYLSIKRFPLQNNNGQRERIIAFNLNTFMFRPYSVSDMINFGHIDDMKKYWCIEFDTRELKDLPSADTLLGWSKQKLAEVYFVSSFVDNVGEELVWSLEGSWKVVAERFCILNTYDIDLYWKKYTRKEFRHENYISSKDRQINFAEWLILQSGMPQDIPEELISSTQNF